VPADPQHVATFKMSTSRQTSKWAESAQSGLDCRRLRSSRCRHRRRNDRDLVEDNRSVFYEYAVRQGGIGRQFDDANAGFAQCSVVRGVLITSSLAVNGVLAEDATVDN
jgi:hypothetical protein